MTGEEFQSRRRAAGYNLRKYVAGDIGVSIDTVKDWERGRHKVPKYAIKWLERVEHKAKKKGRI